MPVLSVLPSQLENIDYLLNRLDDVELKAVLVRLLRAGSTTLRGQWDFATSGGAVSEIPVLDFNGNQVVIPAGWMMKRHWQYVITAPLSAGSATLSYGQNGSVVAYSVATAVASLTIGAFIIGKPIGTASTMLAFSAEKTVIVDIAVAAMTAGKIMGYFEILPLSFSV